MQQKYEDKKKIKNKYTILYFVLFFLYLCIVKHLFIYKIIGYEKVSRRTLH
jgi:hypothetical protein